jgi:hypothetical protein
MATQTLDNVLIFFRLQPFSSDFFWGKRSRFNANHALKYQPHRFSLYRQIFKAIDAVMTGMSAIGSRSMGAYNNMGKALQQGSLGL